MATHSLYSIRPAIIQDDADGIVAVYNASWPESASADRMRESAARRPVGDLYQCLVACDTKDTTDAIIACSEARHAPWMRAGTFSVDLAVAPDWQRQGIGARLYDEQLRWMCAHGATRLEAEAPDHLPAALRFAERRGFAINRHIFDSVLDLMTFDEAPFVGAIARAEADGIRFASLAGFGDSEDAQRKLYAINRAYSLDTPGSDNETFAPFEEWRKFVCGASWYRADGQIVAIDSAQNNDWVGMAAVGIFAEKATAHHMMTGVDRAYRGRGLAQALKLLALRCARRYGAIRVTTNNDSLNAPILAINRKLGYQPQPGHYTLVTVLNK